jgi:polysaccharide export outer membrane protein
MPVLGAATADDPPAPDAAPTEYVATAALQPAAAAAPRPEASVPGAQYDDLASIPVLRPSEADSHRAFEQTPQRLVPPELPSPQLVASTQPAAAPPAGGPDQTVTLRASDTAPAASAATNAIVSDYKIGPGDRLRMTVRGEDDLSGEFDVDPTGQLPLPLIGKVQVAGQGAHDLELVIAARLADGYLRDPQVRIEVKVFRPINVIGEVIKPGPYAYTKGMNAAAAITLAGGYTHKADNEDVYVLRENEKQEVELSAQTELRPGDTVRVKPSFW